MQTIRLFDKYSKRLPWQKVGLSSAKLAQYLGISAEKVRAFDLSFTDLQKVADVLHMDLADFFEGKYPEINIKMSKMSVGDLQAFAQLGRVTKNYEKMKIIEAANITRKKNEPNVNESTKPL